ncbi:hypothetical protein [Gilliamella sp. Occ4-3]|uniref:hypothetical protein n=1 Tax=Gilliamella sp. Occ4-3 TaxID=3120254 RepID=UPI00117A2131|nr:hypothetical protein [Gilliamella apicola]
MPTKARKTWAQQLQQNHSVTIAMNCAIVGLSRCAYYYQPKLQDDSVVNIPNLVHNSRRKSCCLF